MSNLISVNNAQIRQLIYRGQPVVTFQMVADVHDAKIATVEGSYHKNAQHFVDGKHTFLIEGEELQGLKSWLTNSQSVISANARSLRVFTEQGYYMLVKPMRDETSWRVQSEMAETYFRAQHGLLPTTTVNRQRIETTQEIIELHTLLYDFFRCPRSVMLVEASKDMKKNGIDMPQYLLASSDMDNIPDTDVYLEPTELGMRFGLSGKDMNLRLRDMGLQARVNGSWVATDAADGIWSRHNWTNGDKSGYNMKWNLSAISRLMDRYLENTDADNARFN